MLSKILLTVVLAVATTTAFAATKFEAGKYNVDAMHSKVGFEVPHLVISTVDGVFKNFSGVLTLDEKFEKSKLEADVEIKSIETSVADRDTHLKGADFFDAEKFPKMTFKSTGITGKPESFKMTGDLTIKDKTKKVTFVGSYKGSAKDMYGNLKAAFTARTKISRKEFGLSWNKVVEAGPVVGDEITIDIKIEAAKDAPKEAAPAKK